MKKKTITISIFSVLTLLLAVVIIILSQNNDDNRKPKDTPSDTDSEVLQESNLAQVKADFASDLQELKDGKYANLKYNEFTTSIEDVEGVYNLEILINKDYEKRTYLESFAIMNGVIDKFFQEDFDKSYLLANPFIPGTEERIEVNYNDVETVFMDEKYKYCSSGFLYGNEDTGGKYFVQTMPSYQNTWFSRYDFGTILPGSACYVKKVYNYIGGIRQVDDATIYLQDGEISLSEMESRVLNYLNGEDFPLPKTEEITYAIGDVRILENGEHEGLCFKVRRNYKGVLFEYGSHYKSGVYADYLSSDLSEIDYAVSTYPDTMLSFGRPNSTVVEMEEITNILSLGEALEKLSEDIGENSIYDVYGVELIYRNCEVPDERFLDVESIVEPKWKIITINQNDNKYTLFYVDVATGEITHRCEYYYE